MNVCFLTAHSFVLDSILNQYFTSSLCRRSAESEQNNSLGKAPAATNDALADTFRSANTQKMMANFSPQIRAEIESDAKRPVNENLPTNIRGNHIMSATNNKPSAALEDGATRSTAVEAGGRKQAFSLLREKFERYSRADSKENVSHFLYFRNFGVKNNFLLVKNIFELAQILAANFQMFLNEEKV